MEVKNLVNNMIAFNPAELNIFHCFRVGKQIFANIQEVINCCNRHVLNYKKRKFSFSFGGGETPTPFFCLTKSFHIAVYVFLVSLRRFKSLSFTQIKTLQKSCKRFLSHHIALILSNFQGRHFVPTRIKNFFLF